MTLYDLLYHPFDGSAYLDDMSKEQLLSIDIHITNGKKRCRIKGTSCFTPGSDFEILI